MSKRPPIAHGRSLTVSAVIDHTIAVEKMLAKKLGPDVVARRGARYQTFKESWVDVQRVFWSLQEVIKARKDTDPRVLVNHLIALAGQALKSADDLITASASVPLFASSINVETTFAVLEARKREEDEDGD